MESKKGNKTIPTSEDKQSETIHNNQMLDIRCDEVVFESLRGCHVTCIVIGVLCPVGQVFSLVVLQNVPVRNVLITSSMTLRSFMYLSIDIRASVVNLSI